MNPVAALNHIAAFARLHTLKVPANIGDALQEFLKELINAQPNDVASFALQYFNNRPSFTGKLSN